MAIYFVDYENVGSAGVDGVDYLSDQDEIKIFYSNHADTLKYEQVKQLLATKAKVDLLKIETGTANALDFQLVAMLYYTLEGDEPRYIISRDTGYDMAVKMGEQLGAAGVVKRCISIKKALNDRARTEQAAKKAAESRAAEAEKAANAEEPEKPVTKAAPAAEEPVKAAPAEAEKKETPKRSPRREEPKKETTQEPEKAQHTEQEPAEKASVKQEEPAAKQPKREPKKVEKLTREPVRFEHTAPKKDETAEKKAEPLKAQEKKTEVPAENGKPEKKPAFEVRSVEGAGKASASGILDGYRYETAEAPKAKTVLGESAKSILGQGPKIVVKTMEGGKQVGEATERKASEAVREVKAEKAEKPAREAKAEKAAEPVREQKKAAPEKSEPAKEKAAQKQEEREEAPAKKPVQPKNAEEGASRRGGRSSGRNVELKQDEEYLKKLRYIADDVQRHTGMRLNSSQCEMVLEGLKESEGKDDFYHFFQQKLGNKKGQVFYQQIRSRFKHLKEKLAPWEPPVMAEPVVKAAEEGTEDAAPETVPAKAAEIISEVKEAEKKIRDAVEETASAVPAAVTEEPAETEAEVREEPAPEKEEEEPPKAAVPAAPAQSEPAQKNVSDDANKDNSILGRLGRLLGR